MPRNLARPFRPHAGKVCPRAESVANPSPASRLAMVVRRPFLSYSNADRSFVERVAAGLTAHGLMPIFDHWWLRSASADDLESSKLELQMGINHADAFIYFDSVPTHKSTYVKYECDWAMWRTCSDAPHLHMVCVLMDDPNAQVPHWFQTAIDVTAGAKNLDAVIANLIAALGGEPDVGSSPEVCACRQLALASDFARLRSELRNSNETARREAAILLACLDDDLDPVSLAAAMQELENGLSTVGVERVIFAFGKLQVVSVYRPFRGLKHTRRLDDTPGSDLFFPWRHGLISFGHADLRGNPSRKL